MKKSGLADSPLFKVSASSMEISPPSKPDPTITPQKKEKKETKRKSEHDTTVSRYHDTMTPRYHEAIVPIVRKAVKEFGKEAATHRFTMAEKKSIADIIYTYKNQGYKTSENEVARIAVNYIIEDFKLSGENSILDTILKALKE